MFRDEFSIAAVLTGGSPIARCDIPPDIPVLALEHEQDPVPRSEGRDNPDLPHWTTVHRDLTDLLDDSMQPASGRPGSPRRSTSRTRSPRTPAVPTRALPACSTTSAATTGSGDALGAPDTFVDSTELEAAFGSTPPVSTPRPAFTDRGNVDC